MKKVALFGKIRSGKDTVGKILIEEYGFQRVAFGDGIGEIIEKYFPEALEGGKPRKHYQHIGQQLRVLNQDVWINYLLKKVEKEELLQEFNEDICFTTENETEAKKRRVTRSRSLFFISGNLPGQRYI